MGNKHRLLRSDKPAPNKPLSLTAFTLGYIAVCVLILIGVPTPNIGTRNLIPADRIPLAIVLMAVGYIVLLALLTGIDWISRRLRRRFS